MSVFFSECNENGDIIILGLSQHSEIKITDVFGDNGTVAVQKCDIKADRFGHALINSNCTYLPIKVSDRYALLYTHILFCKCKTVLLCSLQKQKTMKMRISSLYRIKLL